MLLALIVVAAWPCMDYGTVLLVEREQISTMLGFENCPAVPPLALIPSNLNFVLTAIV
jgi:hypothetical protein